jgi:hypothetical protein
MMRKTTWMPQLPRKDREPSKVLDEYLPLRQARESQMANASDALKIELAKVYEIEFRRRQDLASYETALKRLGITVTKATPPFVATVKMLMQVDSKTAAFYANGLRRAEAAKVECEKLVEFFNRPGGIGGLERQRKHKAADSHADSDSSDNDDAIAARSGHGDESDEENSSEASAKIEKKAKKILHRLPTVARFAAPKGARGTGYDGEDRPVHEDIGRNGPRPCDLKGRDKRLDDDAENESYILWHNRQAFSSSGGRDGISALGLKIEITKNVCHSVCVHRRNSVGFSEQRDAGSGINGRF